MAIKAALAASLLVALVVAASASSYTTIITTTSYDEEGMIRQGREEGQQCRQRVQGQEFQSCQRYLRQGRNPQQQEYQEQCCQELKEMDRYQCGCEALRQAVQKAQQGGTSYPGQGEGHQSQGQQIYERARQLPRVCNLREQQCRFNLVFV